MQRCDVGLAVQGDVAGRLQPAGAVVLHQAWQDYPTRITIWTSLAVCDIKMAAFPAELPPLFTTTSRLLQERASLLVGASSCSCL